MMTGPISRAYTGCSTNADYVSPPGVPAELNNDKKRLTRESAWLLTHFRHRRGATRCLQREAGWNRAAQAFRRCSQR